MAFLFMLLHTAATNREEGTEVSVLVQCIVATLIFIDGMHLIHILLR